MAVWKFFIEKICNKKILMLIFRVMSHDEVLSIFRKLLHDKIRKIIFTYVKALILLA